MLALVFITGVVLSLPAGCPVPVDCVTGNISDQGHIFVQEPALLCYAGGDDPQVDRQAPGFELYQEGYHFVLDERWREAEQKFQAFIKKYPRSQYLDDAQYWSAYALKHIDRKSAVKAYVRFIADFPESRYYDDAVADLTELSKDHPIVVAKYLGGRGMRIYMKMKETELPLDSLGAEIHGRMDSVLIEQIDVSKSMAKRVGHPPTQPPMSEKSLEALSHAIDNLRMPPVVAPFPPLDIDQRLDNATRLRIEALRALGDSREDSGAFNAVRSIALNRSDAKPLRLAAMEELSQMHVTDPLPILVEIIKRDTDDDIQNCAINQIGMMTRDKNRSVETLINLFDAIPPAKVDRREEIFFSIAEVGNDRAVDFLSRVARNDQNYDLRSQAIYYLGSIGTPKAHKALLEILQK